MITMILGFVEKYYHETNRFYLPRGELTISLDEVWSLIHLPIMGSIAQINTWFWRCNKDSKDTFGYGPGYGYRWIEL